MDITFYIPDYPDPEPLAPDHDIDPQEEERLFEELCQLVDDGAYDEEVEM